jgi:hypothetical protein
MKYLLLPLLALGCASAPTVTASPVVASDPTPKPAAVPLEHNPCSGPTSEIAFERATPAEVKMRPGDTAPFSWNVTVSCGAIELRGLMLMMRGPDGETETLPVPISSTGLMMITGQSHFVSFTWEVPSTPTAGAYVLFVEPMWIDSFTRRMIVGGADLEKTGVTIRVVDAQDL